MTDRPTVPICTADGAPLLCALSVRESESMPSRLKVCFAASAEDGVAAQTAEGLKAIAPAKAGTAIGLSPEFRLEMN